MGIVGFLQFLLKCVDLFAWPIFALAYPLFASVRAIETNSNYHMRKLVTYWILFSLISLFELSFAKFIEWFPVWSYIKIIAICWLVIPSFTRAYRAYKRLIQLRSYANLQVLINWLNKQDKEHFLNTKETFLSVVEKYIKENGTDALEELIANKSKDAKPNLDAKEKLGVASPERKEMATTIESKGAKPDAEDIKAVANTEKEEKATKIKGAKPNLDAKEKLEVASPERKEMATAIESKGAKPDAEDIKAVANTEKEEKATKIKSEGAKPNFDVEEIKVANREKKEMAAIEVKRANADLAETEKRTAEAVEVKEMNKPATSACVENCPASSDKVQRQWTCAVCQVTTTCETTLNSHLQGKKHIAKVRMQTPKPKNSVSSTTNKSEQANQNPKKCVSGDGLYQSKSKQQGKKVQVNNGNIKWKKGELWCSICNVKCSGEQGRTCGCSGWEPTAEPPAIWPNHVYGWKPAAIWPNHVYGWEPAVEPPIWPNHVYGWEPAVEPPSIWPNHVYGWEPAAEKYIKENGTDALEEFIANKSKGAKPNLDAKEKLGVASPERKEMATTIESKGAKPDVEEIKVVANIEKEEKATKIKSEGAKSNFDAEEIKVANREKKEMAAIESKGAKPDVEEIKAIANSEKKEKATKVELKHANANLAETERRAAEAVKVKEMNMPATAAGVHSASLDKVQRQWTCAVCEVTTTSETTLNSHFQGKKHIAKCKELKAGKQTPKNKNYVSSTTNKSEQANQNPNECVSGDGLNKSKSKQQEKKVQVNNGNIRWQKFDQSIVYVSREGIVYQYLSQ